MVRVDAVLINKLRLPIEAPRTVGEHLLLKGQLHVEGTNSFPEVFELGQSGEGGHPSQSQTPLHRSTVGGLKLPPIRWYWVVASPMGELFRFNHVVTVQTAHANVDPENRLHVGKEHLQVQLLVVAVASSWKVQSAWVVIK